VILGGAPEQLKTRKEGAQCGVDLDRVLFAVPTVMYPICDMVFLALCHTVFPPRGQAESSKTRH
jgi:hypothetical protein